MQDSADEIHDIDIAPLFAPASPERGGTGRQIFDAISGIGFMAVRGFSGAELLTSGRRAELLQIFGLPDAEKEKTLRWNFDPPETNHSRGRFPLQPTAVSDKEGIDIGPGLAHADAALIRKARC